MLKQNQRIVKRSKVDIFCLPNQARKLGQNERRREQKSYIPDASHVILCGNLLGLGFLMHFDAF